MKEPAVLRNQLMVIAGSVLLVCVLLGVTRSVHPSGATAAVPATMAGEQATPRQLKVVVANVRMDDADDGINAWANRRAFLVKTLLKRDPDVMGLQEVTPSQGAYLTAQLKGYAHKPEGSAGGLLSQMEDMLAGLDPIYYRVDRFEAIDETHGMLRPDAPQSPATENAFFTQVVLHDKLRILPDLIVLNTHLRHNQANAMACAQRIQGHLREALKQHPGALLVAMGDMNNDRATAVYAALLGDTAKNPETTLADTFNYAKRGAHESWGNWHAFSGRSAHLLPSDLILAGPGWRHTDATLMRDRDEHGRYPSDHFFVETVLRAGEGRR